MKLGISMWSYFAVWKRGELDIPGFIREAQRIGADGVELLDFFWKDRQAETPAIRTALDETGLPVGVYSVTNNFVKTNPAERAAQVDVIRAGVDAANEFGAKVVRVFAGDVHGDITFDDALGWIIEGLAQAASYAEANGVTLALENHGTLAGRADQVQIILDRVGSPALKANPDTGNFLLLHQTPQDALAALGGRAAMGHFKDFRRLSAEDPGATYVGPEGERFAGTAIGEGDVDLPACVQALREAGFDGWLNIEYEALEDPITGVARSVANAQRILNA